jgi:hypothetical protein
MVKTSLIIVILVASGRLLDEVLGAGRIVARRGHGVADVDEVIAEGVAAQAGRISIVSSLGSGGAGRVAVCLPLLHGWCDKDDRELTLESRGWTGRRVVASSSL